MGCGFFGSEATGNCCSKCWTASLKQTNDAVPVTPKEAPRPVEEEVEPMIINEEVVSKPAPVETPVDSPAPPAVTETKKKKKKKPSYKKMMATMMAGTDGKDAKKEREALSKGLGGGKFTKVEKI